MLISTGILQGNAFYLERARNILRFKQWSADKLRCVNACQHFFVCRSQTVFPNQRALFGLVGKNSVESAMKNLVHFSAMLRVKTPQMSFQRYIFNLDVNLNFQPSQNRSTYSIQEPMISFQPLDLCTGYNITLTHSNMILD